MLCEKAGSTENGKIRKQSQNLDFIIKKKNFILIFNSAFLGTQSALHYDGESPQLLNLLNWII